MTVFHPQPDYYTAAAQGAVFVRFDRGVIRAAGADRLDLLHRLSTNALRDLQPGHETTTIFTSDKGRIIQVVRVLASDDHLLLVLNGPDAAGARAWLDKYTIMDDFTTSDVSLDYAVTGVYGDYARKALESVLGSGLPDVGSVTIAPFNHASVPVVRDTRLSAAAGFLLLVPVPVAEALYTALEDAGIRMIDTDTFHVLRVEAGLPWADAELTEQYNPLEAGLVQNISWTKGCYIGQEVIARLDTYDKVQRHLVGLLLPHQALYIAGTITVMDPDRKKIGQATSVALSPRMNGPIALAYIRTQFAVPGSDVTVIAVDNGQSIPLGTASIVKLPFTADEPDNAG